MSQCVMEAGCSMSDSTPPKLTASTITRMLWQRKRDRERAKDKVFKCTLFFIIKPADITNYTSYNTVRGSSHLHHTYAILLATLQLKGDHSRELLHDSLGHLVVRVGGQARVYSTRGQSATPPWESTYKYTK